MEDFEIIIDINYIKQLSNKISWDIYRNTLKLNWIRDELNKIIVTLNQGQ